MIALQPCSAVFNALRGSFCYMRLHMHAARASRQGCLGPVYTELTAQHGTSTLLARAWLQLAGQKCRLMVLGGQCRQLHTFAAARTFFICCACVQMQASVAKDPRHHEGTLHGAALLLTDFGRAVPYKE
jgi:hypothetical protein